MRLMLLGTAGWMPQADRETACMAVRHDDRLLLLDAGTGVRRLVTDPELLEGIAAVDILLSHFHLDHVIGLTYLSGLRSPLEVSVWGPGALLYGEPTAAVLDRLVRPPFQPQSLSSIARVADIPEDGLRVGSIDVQVRHQPRHTAPSLALRLADALSYCTDTAYDPENADFSAGCRLLLHEAACTGEQGSDEHSSAAEAARIAADAAVEELLLVHLAPTAEELRLSRQARAIFVACGVATDLLERELTQS